MPAIQSIFVPLTLDEAQRAISLYDLEKFGLELIPIPAAGGCVIAIREIERADTRPKRTLIPWLGRIRQARAETRLRSVLQALAIAHPISEP